MSGANGAGWPAIARYERAQVFELWAEELWAEAEPEGTLRVQVRAEGDWVLIEVVYGGTAATLADAPREVLEYALGRLARDLFTGRLTLKEDERGR